MERIAVGDGRSVKRAIAEQIDRRQCSRCVVWRSRTAVSIDRRVGTIDVAIIDVWKISKDSLSRHIRQSRAHDILAFQIALTFEQQKEECLVLYDRAADARSELITVVVVFIDVVEIV